MLVSQTPALVEGRKEGKGKGKEEKKKEEKKRRGKKRKKEERMEGRETKEGRHAGKTHLRDCTINKREKALSKAMPSAVFSPFWAVLAWPFPSGGWG